MVSGILDVSRYNNYIDLLCEYNLISDKYDAKAISRKSLMRREKVMKSKILYTLLYSLLLLLLFGIICEN